MTSFGGYSGDFLSLGHFLFVIKSAVDVISEIDHKLQLFRVLWLLSES